MEMPQDGNESETREEARRGRLHAEARSTLSSGRWSEQGQRCDVRSGHGQGTTRSGVRTRETSWNYNSCAHMKVQN